MTYAILRQDVGQKIARPCMRASTVAEAVEMLIHCKVMCTYSNEPGTASYRTTMRDANRASKSARDSYEAHGRAIGLMLGNIDTEEPVMTLHSDTVKFFMFLEP